MPILSFERSSPRRDAMTHAPCLPVPRTRLSHQLRRGLRLLAALFSLALVPAAQAAVERVEITSRTPLANGQAFGQAGAYERITGRLHYAVDPSNDANLPIVDLALAPRDARGKVRFAGDFTLIRPIQGARANGRLLYEVNNRGNYWLFSLFQNGPFTNDLADPASIGDGWLLEQGYSLLWTGWNWDVVPGGNRQGIDLPVARQRGGAPIQGKVVNEIFLNAPAKAAPHRGILAKGYPFAPGARETAELTVRDTPTGTRTVIPRSQWQLARLDGDKVVPDDGSVYLETGLLPGRIYELSYTAQDPVVVGLGLASIRDAISFFRHEPRDAAGQRNPLLDQGGKLPTATLAFGISQSGRVIQSMLLQGLHVDEQRRPTFDGAFVHVAGAGKGGFNYRWAQTTRHFSHFEESTYPTDYFPFTTVPQTDDVSGARGSVLDRARASGVVPKLIYTSSSTDYWVRAASLLHTDTAGRQDLPLAPNARAYLLSGAQHVIATPPARGVYENCLSPTDYRPQLRALLAALDGWVAQGTTPPDSRIPTIADGSLVGLDAYLAALDGLPAALRRPTDYLRPPRLDLGPRFASEGIPEVQPPVFGARYGALVPQVGADGNELAGLKTPQVAVPLGAYLGWNLRTDAAGAPQGLARLFGSFVPRAAGDLPARQVYVQQVERVAREQVQQGVLLARDVAAVVRQAGAFHDRVAALAPGQRDCGYLAAAK